MALQQICPAKKMKEKAKTRIKTQLTNTFDTKARLKPEKELGLVLFNLALRKDKYKKNFTLYFAEEINILPF